MAGYSGTRYAMKCRVCSIVSDLSVYPLDAEVSARDHHKTTGHKPTVWVVRNGRFAQHTSAQPQYTGVYNNA